MGSQNSDQIVKLSIFETWVWVPVVNLRVITASEDGRLSCIYSQKEKCFTYDWKIQDLEKSSNVFGYQIVALHFLWCSSRSHIHISIFKYKLHLKLIFSSFQVMCNKHFLEISVIFLTHDGSHGSFNVSLNLLKACKSTVCIPEEQHRSRFTPVSQLQRQI